MAQHYMMLLIWVAAKAIFWMGAVQERLCPTPIVVLLAVACLVLAGAICIHFLIFASYHESKQISMRYDRDIRKAKVNSERMRGALASALQVMYVVMLTTCLTALPFLFSEGMPETKPDDASLSCQAGWVALWVDVVFVLAAAVVRVLAWWFRIESLEALFKGSKHYKSVAEAYAAHGKKLRQDAELEKRGSGAGPRRYP